MALGPMLQDFAAFIGTDCYQKWQQIKPFRADELELIAFQWVACRLSMA